MSNIPSEVGKVAGTAIDAMRSSPALLAVILLQVAMLAALYFANQANQTRAHTREMFLMDKCFPRDDGRRDRLLDRTRMPQQRIIKE